MLSGDATMFGDTRQVGRCRHGSMIYARNDVHIGRSLDLYGEWAEAEMELLGLLCQPGDLVVDVGANIGTHTVFLARRVGPGGRVFSFEPQRLAFQLLCANIALNDLGNVVALPCAAGQEMGTIQVPDLDYGAAGNYGGLTLCAAADQAHSVPAPITTLDRLARDHLAPDGLRCRLVKIDVEGMELEVLQGAAQFIAATAPFIYLENNDARRSPALIRWLQARDYRLFWHLSRFFNPHNFRGNQQNVFGATSDLNMLAVRPALASAFASLPEVTGPDDTWTASVARLGR